MTENHIESNLKGYSKTKVNVEMNDSTNFDEKQSEKSNVDRDIRQFLYNVRMELYTRFLSKCMYNDDTHSLHDSEYNDCALFCFAKSTSINCLLHQRQSDVDRQ